MTEKGKRERDEDVEIAVRKQTAVTTAGERKET